MISSACCRKAVCCDTASRRVIYRGQSSFACGDLSEKCDKDDHRNGVDKM